MEVPISWLFGSGYLTFGDPVGGKAAFSGG